MLKNIAAIAALLSGFILIPYADAQQLAGVRVVASCGALSPFGVIAPGHNYSLTVDTNGEACVNATVTATASISGFTPTPSYATGTTSASDQNVALPTGTEFIVTNTGANTLAFNIGATATGSMNVLQPSSWIAIAGTTGAAFHYIEATGAAGTTTFSISGGAGIPTGAGGGTSSGSGSNASVSATGSAVPASATYMGMLVGGNLTGVPGTANGIGVQQATAANLNATVVQATAASLNATVSPVLAATWGLLAQNATTSGQLAELMMGAVTTSPSLYTTGQSSPLSLDTAGNLRVNVVTGGGSGGTSATFGSAFPSTGTAAGFKDTSNNLAAGNLDSSGNLKVSGGATQATNSVPINISTATTTQLVALSSGKVIQITSYDVIAGGTGNITFEYGTGTNCAGGTTILTGAFPLTAQNGVAKGTGIGPVLFVPASNALCALTTASVQMSGSLSYAQF